MKVSTPSTVALVADRGPSAVPEGGGGVRLDEILPDGVLLETRHGAVGDGSLQGGAPIQELVGEHDAGKAQDVDGISDLRLPAGQREGRVVRPPLPG